MPDFKVSQNSLKMNNLLAEFLSDLKPPLSLEQKSQLKDLILAEMANISRLGEQIAESPFPFVVARQKADRLRRLQSAREILAPISKLPVELMVKIFREVSSTNIQSLAIRHTSPTWNMISTMMPELWTTLDVKIPFAQNALSNALGHFKRADARFPVRIRISQNEGTELSGSMTGIASLTHSYAHVIGSLYLCVRDPADLDELFLHLEAAVILKELYIWYNGSSFETHLFLNPLAMNVPWSQLVTLKITFSVKMTMARNIVTQCEQIQTFVIALIDDDPVGSAQNIAQLPLLKPTRLAALTSFILHVKTGSVPYSLFFDAFTLPALTRVHLAFPTTHNLTDVAGLLDLRRRSHFKLEAIELSDAYLEDTAIIDFLRDNPTVRRLSVNFAHLAMTWRRMAGLFVLPGTDTLLLPKLTRLSIYPQLDPAELWAHPFAWLMDIVESRHPQLSTVDIRGERFCRDGKKIILA